jgi:hypothetical protein
VALSADTDDVITENATGLWHRACLQDLNVSMTPQSGDEEDTFLAEVFEPSVVLIATIEDQYGPGRKI